MCCPCEKGGSAAKTNGPPSAGEFARSVPSVGLERQPVKKHNTNSLMRYETRDKQPAAAPRSSKRRQRCVRRRSAAVEFATKGETNKHDRSDRTQWALQAAQTPPCIPRHRADRGLSERPEPWARLIASTFELVTDVATIGQAQHEKRRRIAAASSACAVLFRDSDSLSQDMLPCSGPSSAAPWMSKAAAKNGT